MIPLGQECIFRNRFRFVNMKPYITEEKEK